MVENTRAKSQVWAHFWLRKRGGVIVEGIAVCKQCHLDIKTAGGTTNLASHLRRRHPLQMVGAAASLTSKRRPTSTSSTTPLAKDSVWLLCECM